MKSKSKLVVAIALIIVFVLVCAIAVNLSNPETKIVGRWYNEDGDCLIVQSDNTYRMEHAVRYGYDIGSDQGEWEYLSEERIYKFTDLNGDEHEFEMSTDENGENFKYYYYGVFYKD